MKYKTFRAVVLVSSSAILVGGGALLVRACGSDGDKTGGERASSPAEATPPVERRAPPPQPTDAVAPPPASAGSVPLRPLDRKVLDAARRPISGGKAKDAVKGERAKVNLYADTGSRVNRLKIDLDRDDKWDEKWTFEREEEREEVKRQVAPADDESYTEEYRLRAGVWVRQ